MAGRQLKLGAIPTGAGGPDSPNRWLDPDIPPGASADVAWYVEFAQMAEAALFDWIFLFDSQYITDRSPPHYLNRLEPFTLLSALAMVTKHIGLAGTFSTSYNEPFNLARRLASLDVISGGRAGWNVVTTGDAGTASNFSRDEHFDYETRYRRAHEFIAVAKGLWGSYEADAFVHDRASGVFFDKSKLHALNHKGEFFSVRGPLNLQRCPQGEPVLFQAGDSEPGRNLGAAVADAIFTQGGTLEESQAFYRDIKQRVARAGRDPDSVLIMPSFVGYIGDTDDEALRIKQYYRGIDQSLDQRLTQMGRTFGGHDFRGYDLDAPFPAEALADATTAYYTRAQTFARIAAERGLSLRETLEVAAGNDGPGPFIGTARKVADSITDWFEARAFDGLNVYVEHPSQFRRLIDEVLPILRARGVVRTAYDATTLRGNLGLPSR